MRPLLAAVLIGSLVPSSLGQMPIEGDPAHAASSTATTLPATSPTAQLSAMLPEVRLTPRGLAVADLSDARLSLDGEWQFVHAVPANFDGDATKIANWRPVAVPGHFALQGFPRMHEAEGVPVAYTKTVNVPANWQGRRIALRFEGVDGLTKLWVNGKPAGSVDIACLPSEYDITDLLNIGEENRLTLTVEKSLVTRWSRRELGGITRNAYLQAMPSVNLARVHIDTDPAVGSTRAKVNVRIRVANQDVNAAAQQLRVTLRDGEAVVGEKQFDLGTIAAGSAVDRVVSIDLENAKLWSAESPTLYTAHVELLDEGKPTSSVTQRFGVREVRVWRDQLLVNGVPVKLRGANYHITYPGLGESVPKDKIAADLKLFKEANFNTLRSRPTPSVEYADLCDEMGMYTTVEAMISLMIYDKGPKKDHGADPAIEPGYRLHVATMIESLYSHPSILTWGLGNECPYYEYFKNAAVGMKRADPTRPLFFGSDMRIGVSTPGMDMNDDHYPRKGNAIGKGSVDDLSRVQGEGWDYPDDKPNIFTEWLHVPTNNLKEIDFDPGIEDFWGYVARVHIEHMNNTRDYAGGFLFLGAPYRAIGVTQQWRGIFDDDRRITDLFWHVKKSHSPVQIHDRRGTWSEGIASFDVENRFDFTDLSALKFEWNVGDEKGLAKAAGAPHTVGKLSVPLATKSSDPIHVRVLDASDHVIDEANLTLSDVTAAALTLPAAPNTFTIVESPDTIRVQLDQAHITIDRATGLPNAAEINGEALLDGPPTLLVLPAQLSKFILQQKLTLVNQCVGWKASDVKIEKSEDQVKVISTGAYTAVAGTFTTTITRTGEVTITYDFEWTDQRAKPFNCFSWGLAIPVKDRFDTLKWDRNAQWTAYPPNHIGRPVGEARATGPKAPDAEHVWSHVLVDGVTRDFRSTKFHVRQGGLVDDAGKGLFVVSDGKNQHLQAVPINGDLEGKIFTKDLHGPRRPGYFLHVLRFHSGGTEPHLTKSLVFDTLGVNAGARFADTVTLRIQP